MSTSISAGVRANESYRTPVVRPESGARVWLRRAPVVPVGPYEEFAGRHTIIYPLWALLASDWELAYGWCVADQAAQLEAYLKQCYKQHDDSLPALVQRSSALHPRSRRRHDSRERQHLVSRIVCYHPAMGIRNYLIEGVSGTGKTSVCDELQRRGYHAIHGDRELAYQGDPETGEPTDGFAHEHHIWHVDKVKALVANHDEAVTFFCGGSRNFAKFIHLFDGVFVLEVDLDTLNRRLDERPDSEWGGGKPTGRELIARLHRTKEDIPKNGISIDATASVARVVDEIVGCVAGIASR